MWNELRALLRRIHHPRGHLCDHEGWWTGARNRAGLHYRLGRFAITQLLSNARRVSRRSNAPPDNRSRSLGRALRHRGPRPSMVADTSSWLPIGGGPGTCGQTTRSSYDSGKLRLAHDNLVVANGGSAWGRHLGASAPVGERDYRPRLEAFFEAASVADPAGTADRLSTHYTSLSELLSSDPSIVTDYSNEAAAGALAGARDLMTWALSEKLRRRRPIHAPRDATELLRHLIGSRCDEHLVVLFIDSGRGLIDHEVVAGRASSVDLDCRRILFRAIGRGAAGIIVAHNHPSGDPQPSSSDVRVTRLLADAARAVEITLHDHLILARGHMFSFRQAGLI
jgi:DNA repair protein RadC